MGSSGRETREVAVGGLVLVLLALVFAYSYAGEKLRARAAPGGQLIDAVFNRVDGLLEGDSVQLGGIRIGVVHALGLDRNYRAIATLRIDPGVALPADTSAAIHTDGLFGAKFVVLEPGGDEKMLRSGDRITFTQDSVVVADLLDLIIAQGRARRAESGEGK